ncbi:MAG: biotin/lipoyl-containing protein, partial [Tepidiformaceae bacterium]
MTQVTMPQLGESVTEGTILKWLKQTGDAVALDDSLCEIETEKVTAELPSPFEGTMGAILVPEGETVVVGAPLCEVDEAPAGSTPAAPAQNGTAHRAASSSGTWSGGPMAIPPDEEEEPAAVAAAASPALVASPSAAPTKVAATARKPEARERFYSPAVMRLAHEHAL